MILKSNKVQIQGSVDGLCGIYSLVHYLEKLRVFPIGRSETRAKSAFSALLKSAEVLVSPVDNKPLLSAKRIAAGYYTDDLVEIFNATMMRKRLNYRASLLEAICEHEDGSSTGEVVRSLIHDGASVVLQVRGEEHFVLAVAIDESGCISVRDSGHHANYRLEELKRPASEDGVVLAKVGTPAHKRMR